MGLRCSPVLFRSDLCARLIHSKRLIWRKWSKTSPKRIAISTAPKYTKPSQWWKIRYSELDYVPPFSLSTLSSGMVSKGKSHGSVLVPVPHTMWNRRQVVSWVAMTNAGAIQKTMRNGWVSTGRRKSCPWLQWQDMDPHFLKRQVVFPLSSVRLPQFNLLHSEVANSASEAKIMLLTKPLTHGAGPKRWVWKENETAALNSHWVFDSLMLIRSVQMKTR